MDKRIILIAILTLLVTLCKSQTEEEEIRNATVDALKEWFENPSIKNEILDPKAIEQFKDSGGFENGLKEGLWIEYSLDTSLMGQTTTLMVGDKQMPMTFSGVLHKDKGIYINGEKHGKWTMYESRDKKTPFYWNRQTVTNYIYGLKNGEEINYQGYGEEYQSPLMIRNWKNGIEHGIGKIYDFNYPYNLQQVYNAVDGQFWLLEKFYSNGKLQTKFMDTTISGKELKYMQAYYESGQLYQTGYYIHGTDMFGTWTSYYKSGQVESIENYENGKLHGKYQYFHDNGQIWTERTYKEGKLLEVHLSFNKNGKKKDKGTINNGTGFLNIYNAEGKLTKKVEYINGQEKNE